MQIGSFTDKTHEPTQQEIRDTIGSNTRSWDELIQFLREQYPSEEDLKFLYGKKYGWALRFRNRGRLLTSLFPTSGGFTVQIILNQAAIEQAKKIRVSETVRSTIANAKVYPEGRWLFIPVKTKADLQGVHELLALRAKGILGAA